MKKLLFLLIFLAGTSNAAMIQYVRSTDGDNADDGSTWALAKETLRAGMASTDPGGVVYVSSSHAETTAGSITHASSGTWGNPIFILSVKDDAEPPVELTNTSSVTTTGTTAIMAFNGSAYIYGVNFSWATGNSASDFTFTSTNLWRYIFENCRIRTPATNAGAQILAGATASLNRSELIFKNVGVEIGVGNVSQSIGIRTRFSWLGGKLNGSQAPTTLFTNSADAPYDILIKGVDLSLAGSGNTILEGNVDNAFGEINVLSSKLGDSVSLANTAAAFNSTARIINSDSTDTNYRYQKQTGFGAITHETTIVRRNGATDKTTPISFKMVSNSSVTFGGRLESDPMSFWNEQVGSSITISIPVVTDNVTLTNKEAWIEIDCLGTSGFPLSVNSSGGADAITTGSNYSTDSNSNWVTTGLTTPVRQTLSATCQPYEKGMVDVKVVLARPSTTMYFDPKALPSSGRQFMTNGYIYLNETMQSGGGVSVSQ